MNRQALIAKLPPEKGEEKVIRKRQDVADIVNEVLAAHQAFSADYDEICDQFAGRGAERRLYEFCRKNLVYDVESEDVQTTRSPAVLLGMGRCDCKGYAGFVAGVLDGLNRAGHGNYDWCYRFAEYRDNDEILFHVFVVVRKGDREIWIDPVLNQFNKRHPYPDGWTDKERPMTLVRMSGIEQPARRPVLPQKTNFAVAGPLSAYAVGTAPAYGFSPQQLGIPIAQAVFQHWNSEYPGAIAELAVNPPVRFFVGNAQLPLPPPVTQGGQPVPMIPQVYLVWDSTFMGMPIPADMLNVRVINGALQIWPLEIMSAGGTGVDTNNVLFNTHRYLLFLMLGALENLISSYSSWPWGNQFNDLSQQLNSARNYSNWLVYPGAGKKTVLGTVVQDVAKVQQAIAPIAAAVANTFVPGSGTLITAEANLAAAATGNAPAPVNTYLPADQAPAPPGGMPSAISMPSIVDTAVQFAQANPIPTLAIVAAASYFLYKLFSD